MKWFKQLALLVALAASGNMVSVAKTTCIRIADIHGNTSYFVADETLRLEKDGEYIMITATVSEASLKADQLKEFRYESRALSDIREIAPEASWIRMEKDRVRIAAPGTVDASCCVYDVKGTLVSSFLFSEEAEVALNSFPAGVYVIKVENVPAVKFVVR